MATTLRFNIVARDKATRVFDNIGRKSGLLGRSLGTFGTVATGALKGAAIAAGAFGVTVGKVGLQTAAGLQRAEVAFGTLLGSGQRAKRFLEELKAFAIASPFELAGLTQSAAQLLGVGVEARNVIPILRTLGDTASAVGLSQAQFEGVLRGVTQSMALGRVQLEELRQIAETGVPVFRLLSESMGLTIPELLQLSREGGLLAEEVLPKLFAQMRKDFGGSMAKQMETLSGVWNQLTESFKLGTAEAVQPLIPLLQKAIPAAAAVTTDAFKAISAGLADFIRAVTPAFREALPVVKAFINGIQGGTAGGGGPIVTATKAGQQFAMVLGQVIDFAKQAAGALFGVGQSVATGLQPAFQAVIPIVESLRPVFGQIVGFVQSLIPVFGTVFSALGTALSKILPVVRPFIDQLVAVLGPALKDIANIIKTQVAPAFTAFIAAATPIVNFLIKNIFGPAIVGAFKGLVQAIKGALTVISGVFNVLAGLFTGDWKRLWKGVKQIFAGAWEAIKGIFKVVLNVGILRVFGKAVGLLGKLASKGMKRVAKFFDDGIKRARGFVQRGVDRIVGFLRSLPGRALRALARLAPGLTRLFTRAFTAIRRAASRGASRLLSVVRSIPGRIRRALSNAGRLLFQAGRNIISGLINGIRSRLSALISTIRSAASRIRNALPFSPAKEGPLKGVRFEKVGSGIIDDIRRGLSSQQGALAADVRGLASEFTQLGASTRTVVAPRAPTTGGTVQVTFINHGPVGTQADLDNWLTRSMDRLNRTGRLRGLVTTT